MLQHELRLVFTIMVGSLAIVTAVITPVEVVFVTKFTVPVLLSF
jgi:hypothetical protein